jgi:CheY-like chemotaxis protein
MLAKMNIKIHHASNGKEILHLMNTYNGKISLILMDLKMPEMDGLEATRRVRKINQKVPIIMQTAYAMPGDKEKALDAGCNDYITKPINKNNLIDTIIKYI